MFNPSLFLLLLFLGLILSTSVCQAVISISVIRSDAYSGESKVTLVCTGTRNDDPVINFFWEVNGAVKILTGSRPDKNKVAFTLQPDREGFYSCGDTTGNSSETEILAFPHQDPAVRALQPYSVSIGSSVELRCVFRPGALSNRYKIAWFKGVETVFDAVTPLPTRYSINEDFSLVIDNVQVEDGSNAYHCAVNISKDDDSVLYQRVGPDFELEVKDALRITQGPTDEVRDSPGGSASFHCSATGSPSISLRWLFNGEELEQLPSNMQHRFSVGGERWSVESAMASSALVVKELQETDSGTVECVAFQTATSGITMATATAHLVVLGKLQEVTLLKRQEGGPRLKASLPSSLPLPFGLQMQYSHNGIAVDQELMDLKFFDTDTIDYIIPTDKLPQSSSDTFSVHIALQVSGLTGELSDLSNTIAISPPPSSAEGAADAQTLTLGLIIVIVVLLLVVVVIAVIVSLFCYLNHHRKRSREIVTRPPGPGKKILPPIPVGRAEAGGNEYTEYMVMSASEPVAQKLRTMSPCSQDEEEEEEDFKSQGSSYSGSVSRSPSRSLSRTPSRASSLGPHEAVYEEIAERGIEQGQRNSGASTVKVEVEGEGDGEGGRSEGGRSEGEEDLVREMSSEDIFQVGTMTRTPRQGRSSEGEKGPADGEKFSVQVPFTSTH